jgi:hypothetical protein
MAIKTFTTGEVLTASDTNTYLANSGLVYIDTKTLATATTDFIGCFTNTYDNYRLVITTPQVSAAADIYFRLLDNTTPVTSAYYYVVLGANVLGTIQNAFNNTAAEGYTGWTTTAAGAGTDIGGLVFDIQNPFKAKRTMFTGSIMSYQTDFKHATTSITQGNGTAYSGLRITTLTAATLTGTATIYGYRKA